MCSSSVASSTFTSRYGVKAPLDLLNDCARSLRRGRFGLGVSQDISLLSTSDCAPSCATKVDGKYITHEA